LAPATDSVSSVSAIVPPQDREAERATLGAMLISADLLPDLMELLGPDDFYFPEHRSIFTAIRELFGAHRAVDVVTVKGELERMGELEGAGGIEALAEMAADVPAAAGARDYARTVKDHALRRRLIGASLQAIRDARVEGESVDALLARTEQSILAVSDRHHRARVRALQEYLDEVYGFIYEANDRQRRIQGLSTGIFELDDLINGLQGSNLYLVAGRPSMGKTSLALRMLEHVTMEQKVPALLFSLEMAGALLTRIMMCAHCHVNLSNMQKGFISEPEKQKLINAGGRFAEAPLFIDDSSDLSILELRARARRMKAQAGIGLVVVDYLQLVHAEEAQESRQIEIAYISRQLKAVAKELEVPVVVVAQLNRQAETREDKRPRLADLRESGSLEQDADVVLLLFREAVYNNSPEVESVCDLIVAKNRTGPTDTVQATFLREFMRFEPLSYHYAGKTVR
jgi:replicative DNA helicase